MFLEVLAQFRISLHIAQCTVCGHIEKRVNRISLELKTGGVILMGVCLPRNVDGLHIDNLLLSVIIAMT